MLVMLVIKTKQKKIYTKKRENKTNIKKQATDNQTKLTKYSFKITLLAKTNMCNENKVGVAKFSI